MPKEGDSAYGVNCDICGTKTGSLKYIIDNTKKLVAVHEICPKCINCCKTISTTGEKLQGF